MLHAILEAEWPVSMRYLPKLHLTAVPYPTVLCRSTVTASAADRLQGQRKGAHKQGRDAHLAALLAVEREPEVRQVRHGYRRQRARRVLVDRLARLPRSRRHSGAAPTPQLGTG